LGGIVKSANIKDKGERVTNRNRGPDGLPTDSHVDPIARHCGQRAVKTHVGCGSYRDRGSTASGVGKMHRAAGWHRAGDAGDRCRSIAII
jgi:hypothetical protein